jgi:squalene-hopene/tetraprenyl-beta-curcumene cyclase
MEIAMTQELVQIAPRTSDLTARARRAVVSAHAFACRIQRGDGHWCVELESNATITAEYLFMCQALGIETSARNKDMIAYFFGQQKADGSYGLATNLPGDISTTAETYLALRILGVPVDDARMQASERFILKSGGLAKVRVFTRVFFAMFGLFPWSSVPTLPPEFIELPPSSPINVYALASWARGTVVPLLILFHYKPLFALPNGRSAENDYLDHLWIDPTKKAIPYAAPLRSVLRQHGLGWKSFFTAADKLVRAHDAVRSRGPLERVRARALAKCDAWMLARQEPNGDWAGIFPPMLNVVLALYASGRSLEDPNLRLGLDALERFAVHDEQGFRIEPCQSPVWDTILMMIAFADAGYRRELERPREWISKLQIFADYGDWKVYNPKGPPGGWSFEYTNTWYPDVDDTAAIIVGFLKHDPTSRESDSIRKAAAWMVSMQNDDGGWAAFDRANDKMFLNEIPFSDMDALCDPSSPDIAGRVLEALGLLGDPRYRDAVRRGIDYLRKAQEKQGSWFGRWGVNYVYGTSNALAGLARQCVPGDDPMIARAVAWLRSVQNADGGWGECLESYANKALMGKGPSTASQTAWALMGLLAYVPPEDAAVQRGVAWLLDRQNARGSWDEEEFTGTGFPNHFYLRYNLYRHYFPMMALARFARE